MCQELAQRYDPGDIAGTLVLVHVVNVPGFQAQQRYMPIDDLDMNRAFPGGSGNTASRMARELLDAFVSRCERCLDFHTSTRNRTTMYHTRANTADPAVDGLARAFGANVIIDGAGDEGSLRRSATDAGIPTVTVEMGKAHRFRPVLVENAVEGVENVMRAYGLRGGSVSWPGWFQVAMAGEKSWLRADEGGLVDMHWGPYRLVRGGDTICTVSDQSGDEERVVEAPFTGLLVGVLENPVALPGHPLCHLARIGDATATEIARG
jgi:predicted deacylase